MITESTPAVLGLSEGLLVGEYRKRYEQEWCPTEKERRTVELAERYHRETEAYDRTICTGPIRDGSVMPNGSHEMALVNRNAIRVREQIMHAAAQHGISQQDMAHAIQQPPRLTRFIHPEDAK